MISLLLLLLLVSYFYTKLLLRHLFKKVNVGPPKTLPAHITDYSLIVYSIR